MPSTIARRTASRADLSHLVAADHAYLEELLVELETSLDAPTRASVRDVWSRLDRALLAHMALEDLGVYPAIDGGAAAELAPLRREHNELRRELADLGLAILRGSLDVARVGRFVARLRAHDHREELLLARPASAPDASPRGAERTRGAP